VAAAAVVILALALTLPVKLPSAGGGSSSEECLTIADRPVTGDDAMRRLEQCATIVPDDVELLADLGAAYEAAAQSGDAERIYRQILTRDDEYAEIHVRLARLLLQRRDTAAARRHLDRALQIQPNRQAIVTLIEQAGRTGSQ
jgi:tetratricopeptide (TPR) repeat protein